MLRLMYADRDTVSRADAPKLVMSGLTFANAVDELRYSATFDGAIRWMKDTARWRRYAFLWMYDDTTLVVESQSERRLHAERLFGRNWFADARWHDYMQGVTDTPPPAFRLWGMPAMVARDKNGARLTTKGKLATVIVQEWIEGMKDDEKAELAKRAWAATMAAVGSTHHRE